jgi:hypothetical protein
MHVLVIEFDRTRQGETRREKRFWTFDQPDVAERETVRFEQLVHAGGTQFLRGGDRLTFQESRLYVVDADNETLARQKASAGDARLLRHAFNPALTDPAYWDELLEQLEADEAKAEPR